jgi:tetratricopeptide (TPR) repeat protein
MITIWRKLFFILTILNSTVVSAQIPLQKNPEAVAEIKVTLDQIYNFEFVNALQRLKGQHGLGKHPANAVLNAVLIYWRDRPLVPGSDLYQQYENYLNEAIELAQPFLGREDLYDEGAFYCLAGYGLLTELYAEEGGSLKVLKMAKKAYKYLKIGKEKMNNIADFYFSTGLYNYYRVKYPELHPFYKSFMWLFESGDKSLGLEQLKICERSGVFARNEATLYLFHIQLRYENNPAAAYRSAVKLSEKYPGNVVFKCHMAEVQIAMNQFSPAEEMSNQLIRNERIIFQLCGTLFKAIILEKNGKPGEAGNLLTRAIELHEMLRKPDYHYLSMIYATQARIADKQNNMDLATDLYKKALKLDPYIPVQQEAEEYLNR